MRSKESLQIQPSNILPGDSEQIKQLKQKVNEVIQKLDEAYRLLYADVRARDYRELPPHASMDFASFKWYEDKATGDLRLYHRSGDTWSDTGWSVIGDVTRRPSV